MQFYRLQVDSLDWGKIVKRERKFGMSTLGVPSNPVSCGEDELTWKRLGCWMRVTKAMSYMYKYK
jgi:hypothetical protein